MIIFGDCILVLKGIWNYDLYYVFNENVAPKHNFTCITKLSFKVTRNFIEQLSLELLSFFFNQICIYTDLEIEEIDAQHSTETLNNVHFVNADLLRFLTDIETWTLVKLLHNKVSRECCWHLTPFWPMPDDSINPELFYNLR